MEKIRWYFHPLFIFICSLLALMTSLFLYIHWYLKVGHAFQEFLIGHGQSPENFLETDTWAIILILSLLVGLIVIGMALIYTFYQKTKELYRMQQNFINGFTHELKTPLASLRLFLDTFQKYDLPREDQIKYLNLMREDTTRLLNNVERILNMAKIEDKKYRMELGLHYIDKVITTFLKNNEHLFKNAVISFKNENEGVPLVAKFDVKLFEVVLINVILNGIHYNTSSPPKIDIELLKNREKILLRIIDNGIGIDRNHRKKIFKKFFQVEQRGKGTGIGLFLVAQILKLHNFKCWFEDGRNNIGSTFCLLIH